MRDLPQDFRRTCLIGRIHTDDGPTPVAVVDGILYDVSRIAATTSEFIAQWNGSLSGRAERIGLVADVEASTAWTRSGSADALHLLSPIDLQCIKASGVTFAVSAIERVIEERARGDAERALSIRTGLRDRIGSDIASVKPGSAEAQRLKAALIQDGLWSQYLEVAIGPDAEIFTKAPVLSSVGWGAWIGVRSDSHWNNPEPEIAIICDAAGTPRGAALANDVNLRDFEGRSALLLGRAKDNNASCAIGPFIRLFDDHFTLNRVREAVVHLHITGADGFELDDESPMKLISRDPLELIAQTCSDNHQYPDGFALLLGTMFAPVADRDTPGLGFTHKAGDVVRISTPLLGALENKVTACDQAPRWKFGITDLMRNLAARGLLDTSASAKVPR